jgi:hypothetical protein
MEEQEHYHEWILRQLREKHKDSDKINMEMINVF